MLPGQRWRLMAAMALGVRPAHLAAVLRRVAAHHVARQHHDVVAAIAQRRQVQVHDVEAVVEVLAEAAGLHLDLEVAVGGGEDADVDRLGAGVADAHHHLLLQRAQDLDLQRQRHLADLVEEQGAAVGRLEAARLVADGAGEGAAHVAEQLRLEQVLGDGAAVDGDERALGARRAAVELARDQLLAGAGLAGDEHRDVGGRDLLDLAEDLLHARRTSRGSRRSGSARCAPAASGCRA